MESRHRFSRSIRAVGALLGVLIAGLLAANLQGETAAAETCAGSLQARIDAAPSGTTVVAEPCIYRERVTITKPLTLQGQPGSEIRGSDVWTDWQRSDDGTSYVSEGVVPAFTVEGKCKPGTSECLRPEQVFVDGEPLEQLPNGAIPSEGQFALDSGRRVVLGDDPSGKQVEVSVRRQWVVGRAPNVTIEGFEMKHAANDSQYRAALTNERRANWTLEDSELSYSHGALVSFRGAAGLKIANNELRHGGQLGVHASDGKLVLWGNEIHHNNVSDFDPGWEAGGVKAVRMASLDAHSNNVKHNDGNGLWCDVGCRDTTFRYNRVHHNTWSGIFFEVSDGAKIHDNTVYENGWGKSGSWVGSWQGAIHISNSRNAEVYDNTVAWNRSNISVVRIDRSGDYPAYNDVYGNYVHDNRILSADYPSAASYDSGSRNHALSWVDKWTGSMYEASKNNRGESNEYYFAKTEDTTIPRYFWGGKATSVLGSFNSTRGEDGGRYLTRSEKDALVASEDIPAGPEHPPSYSSDLNPIEQAFSKIKELLREACARIQRTLMEVIGEAL